MDIKTIKNEISFINEAINEEIEMVLKHKNRIPRIELDMIMSNIQELYEYFYKLQKLNNNLTSKPLEPIEVSLEKEKPKIKEKAEPEQIKVTPVVEEKPKPKIIEKVQQEEVKVVSEKIEAEQEKLKEKIVEVIPPLKEKIEEPIHQQKEKPVEAKTFIKTKKPKIPVQKKSTLDLFAETTNTIGDKFLEKKDKSIAAQMSHNHINNIKKAIGINEKFLFINELFNGNMQEYNKALDSFNSFENSFEASQLIDELKLKYKWKTENNSFLQFMEIIKRKFS